MGFKGQTFLEYILMIGIVTMTLIYMGTDFKRALQNIIRLTASQMGSQANAEQDKESTTGYMENQVTTSASLANRTKKYLNGVENLINVDVSQSTTITVTNAGYTKY